MRKLRIVCMLIVLLSIVVVVFYVGDTQKTNVLDTPRNYYRIVILSDPHYPTKISKYKDAEIQKKNIKAKLQVIDDINSWDDVDMVVVVGDIVAESGTIAEYTNAKDFIGRLKKPVNVIMGNHDYIYADSNFPGEKLHRGNPEVCMQKIQRFKETYGLNEVYYSKSIGNYLLAFLSPNATDGKYLTQIGERQLDWFKYELKQNKEKPTIVFFHAPLKGTLKDYSSTVNTKNFIAQPSEELKEVILENPQIFLWVSGHTHTAATNESFNSMINIFEGRVHNIHNSDMDRQTIWTNSLYLYPDRVVVRTFNHKTGTWLEMNERKITLP